MIHCCFLRTVVSVLRVYPMQGPGTSVELLILPTHLQSSSYEVVCTEEWVDLLRWKKRSHTRGVVVLLCLYRRRAPIWEQPLYGVVHRWQNLVSKAWISERTLPLPVLVWYNGRGFVYGIERFSLSGRSFQAFLRKKWLRTALVQVDQQLLSEPASSMRREASDQKGRLVPGTSLLSWGASGGPTSKISV